MPELVRPIITLPEAMATLGTAAVWPACIFCLMASKAGHQIYVDWMFYSTLFSAPGLYFAWKEFHPRKSLGQVLLRVSFILHGGLWVSLFVSGCLSYL
jgi:hypothetical protein